MGRILTKNNALPLSQATITRNSGGKLVFIAVIKSSAVVASACLIDRVYTHDVNDNVSTAAADRCRTSVECCQRTDEATD